MAIFSLLAELYRNRELIWALALKELHIRYKRSALGFLWSLLNPLLMMTILSVVFSTVVRIGVKQYAIFLMSALLPWTFLAQSLAYSADSLVGNGELLKKIYVAKTAFPVAAVLSNVINFLLSLIPLLILMVALRFPFHWTWVYLPVPLLALLMFATGCGLFCAAANVFFRDVAHILQVVISAWFYASPVMYSLDFVPDRYRIFFRANPMVYILNGFRMAIYHGMLPSGASIAMSLAVGLVTLMLGYAFFRRVQDSLVYYL
jgi:ABC-type polysaccharide/polyol phosphate export permease